MTKLCFLDVETTGTNPARCAIHQISGSIYVDGEFKESFDYHVRPFEGAEINQDALDVGGLTTETLMSYPPHEEVFRSFVAMLSKYVNRYDRKDKFHMVGYNCQSFDSQFMRNFFLVNGDPYYGSWFWPDTIDVMILASAKLIEKRSEMPNFRLSTVASFLGITLDESKLHDSSYDIKLTEEVYKNVCQ